MMLRLQKYDYKVRYERGENPHLADTLSRAYLPTDAHPTGPEFEHINTATFLPVSTSRLQEIQQATESDEALRILKNIILHGRPEHRGQVPSQITPCFSMRDELAIQDGVIFCGQGIVVPVSLQQDIKRKLHASHLARYGCPECLINESGPQFTSSEFAKFAKEWDFEHKTNSPGNSKANGKVESAVKTAKNLIRKALDSRTDPYSAILDYCNTPTQEWSQARYSA